MADKKKNQEREEERFASPVAVEAAGKKALIPAKFDRGEGLSARGKDNLLLMELGRIEKIEQKTDKRTEREKLRAVEAKHLVAAREKEKQHGRGGIER